MQEKHCLLSSINFKHSADLLYSLGMGKDIVVVSDLSITAIACFTF